VDPGLRAAWFGLPVPRSLWQSGSHQGDPVYQAGSSSGVKEADPIDPAATSGFECRSTGIQGRTGGDHIIKEEDCFRDRFGTADSAQEVGSPVVLLEGLLAL
jgi:hypothetical protein